MQAVRLVVIARGLALAASLVTIAATSSAQVALADRPVFTSVNVPGNLALALSVEFPTAISVAHPNRSYSPANTYIGYFDPAKCYTYRYTNGTGDDNYFFPDGAASNRTCTGKWSGNFLNWASMQTIDPFRWALTGGYRMPVHDTASLTVLEKAWATSQGSTSNFPDSTITGTAVVAGATPFSSGNALSTRIWALGNKMRFVSPIPSGANGASFTASYFNGKTLSGSAVATRTEGIINYNVSGTWFPSPAPTTNVSARWTGTVTAPTAGNYSFRIRGDDGVKLSVRVNNSGPTHNIGNTGWKDQGATNYDLNVPNVSANDTLNIEVEYYQGGGGAEVSLRWQPPGAGSYALVGEGLGSNLYAASATHYNPATALQNDRLYEVFVRVKVCDSAAGLEANCTLYGTNSYKPTGLMQQYADKIRYSAFGYLNDDSVNRDGGVLRARQKFIGPTRPVPGGIPVANGVGEWDATTGVMLTNPDPTDASASGVSNSGVMNYLNKFGQVSPGSYKTYDPVGELYYAAQRYYRNLGNVASWTNNATATHKDGFPVITTWDDPIQYSCQRNFILGIGDVNTHADRNLPGATGGSEPTKPAEVTADTGVNATDWTNRVGVLQGGLGSTLGATQPYGGCCTNNGALMAGLAYWANINDIRSDKTGEQTIQTYWLDVLEYGNYKSNNQFYLAAKYGGFKRPTGYSDATATTTDFADNAASKSWWSTTTDTVGGQPRPDNYYTADRADQMVSGLQKTFSSIASQLSAYSTSFSTALPQVSALGVASYSTKFDAKSWTGELEASLTTFNATTGAPSLTSKWTFSGLLDAQAAGSGWDTGRNIVTYDTVNRVGVRFRSGTGGIPTAQLDLLDTSYVTGNDAQAYLNYLRGNRTQEVSNPTTGVTKVYRDRAKLLGDIVNAKARPVAAPAAPYSAANNPGYDTFKTTHANRTPMVYVGSNDGMLHAVNGTLTGTDAGKEVWAYIPGVLFNGPSGTPSVDGLASIGNPTFDHRFMVDATPLTIDVDFGRTPGGTGTDWRTILVGGLGKGGKAIYALDITDPASVTSETIAAQKVLWEFTHNDLGFTYGQPVIIKTRRWGWTLVVGSGYNNADGHAYFFFINPRNGALLEKVAATTSLSTAGNNYCAACSASNQAGMAHVNAFVLDLTDGYADAVYGGDLMGNLWRLDITGNTAYPAPEKFATLTGAAGAALPVTSKPLPIVQPGTNRRYITVGTGRLLDATDLNNTQAQRFFAILDGTNASFSKDGTITGQTRDLPLTTGNFPLTVSNMLELTNLNNKISLDLRTQIGWYVDLGVSAGGPGWRVLSDPTSFYGTVAFSATSPSSSDPCSPNGTSRIYVIDLGSGFCGLTGGGAGCYVSKTDGVVIDLTFYSVNINGVGKSVLLAGKDNCSGTNCQPVEKVDTVAPTNLGLQRLNWREILVNN